MYIRTPAGPWLLLAVLMACSCGTSNNMVCEPGDQKSCDCIGGEEGVQVCRENGSGWEKCDCPEGECSSNQDCIDLYGDGHYCDFTVRRCKQVTCTPDCGGRECGPDPVCQTSCGTCDQGHDCIEGQCVARELCINLPTFTVPFSVDAADLIEEIEQWLTAEGNPMNLDGLGELPAGAGTVQQTFGLTGDILAFDLTADPDLSPYAQAGKVLAVEVSAIATEIADNTFTPDAVEAEYLAGPPDAALRSDCTLFGACSIPAGMTGPLEVSYSAGGSDVLRQRLLDLTFSLLAVTSWTIDTDVSRALPSGTIEARLEIDMVFTVEPL